MKFAKPIEPRRKSGMWGTRAYSQGECPRQLARHQRRSIAHLGGYVMSIFARLCSMEPR